MNEFMERLEKWGADPEEAIQRMVNDELFYRSLLEKIVKKKEWELFRTAIEEGDYNQAFRIAHDIKGTTAVLSLMPLYNAVKPIVEELREGTPGKDFSRETEIFFHEIEMFQDIFSETMISSCQKEESVLK